MRYSEALVELEKWLKEIQTESFCENVCHGRCCRERNKNREILFKCESKCAHKPLSCSIYFCEYILNQFAKQNPSTTVESYKNNQGKILIILQKDIGYRYHPEEARGDADIPDELIGNITKLKFNPKCLSKENLLWEELRLR
jgi:hypothetical protein